MPGQVEPRPDLLHELRGHASPLRRRVEADAPQPVAERLGDAQRLLRLVLEGVDQDDARHVGVDVAIERLRGLTVSPKISTSACGMVPVGASPASRAPAGVEAPMQPPTTLA